MTQAFLVVSLFVVFLAMIPLGLKWIQRRLTPKNAGTTTASRIISAIAVGPHQKVVTIEVGPSDMRVWLTLGVTSQTVSCLHTMNVYQPQSASSEPDLLDTSSS